MKRGTKIKRVGLVKAAIHNGKIGIVTKEQVSSGFGEGRRVGVKLVDGGKVIAVKIGSLEPIAMKRRMTFEKSSSLAAVGAGGPIEDPDTSIQTLTNAGFDLEKYDKDINEYQSAPLIHEDIDDDDDDDDDDAYPDWDVTPMIYFCRKGDLKMCRYLLVNGADCRKKGGYDAFWCPMYAAACRGHLDVCKWLYKHGARDDIRTRNWLRYTALRASFEKADTSTCQWLIMNGALCQNNSDTIDDTIMRRDLSPQALNDPFIKFADVRPQLLLWAQEIVQLQSAFLIFLGGAIVTSALDSSQPLQISSGKSGIMELIGDYTGVERRASKLRILWQLTDLLSAFIQDAPFG
jgi:hypothetical protein